MRVAHVDGLLTLFYDGSELYNHQLNSELFRILMGKERRETEEDMSQVSEAFRKYWRERQSWQQIIVEEGVKVIPHKTFYRCFHIQKVIFANTVIRVEPLAFFQCYGLVFLKLSINLKCIAGGAFEECDLSSVFVPSQCKEIGTCAFAFNKRLSIFHILSDARLKRQVIAGTALINDSPFDTNRVGHYSDRNRQVEKWIKNINSDIIRHSLHRVCSSIQPRKEVIDSNIEDKGIGAFKEKNEIGISASQYLQANPFADVKEAEIIREYILKKMGGFE
ncbi:hypothetical protein CTEN210_02830 [Chaetoceros tenuissimus]|uniref:Uncharacterized protein n=1 Tax=Chaetoceros tenuissimus TaxID=426638 RepID=A0AAD3CK54_9STRA|nr:hypothetical protein CTEN210_02830 [Chaetoceros tenuissimus]